MDYHSVTFQMDFLLRIFDEEFSEEVQSCGEFSQTCIYRWCLGSMLTKEWKTVSHRVL